MPIVIPVRTHFNAEDLWFAPEATGAVEGDYVVVTTERGTEFGLATHDPFEVPADELPGKLQPVLRIASDEDIDHAEELAIKGDEAMPYFRELVKKHNLDMKPAGVEFLFGGEKIVFYFAAEERVDFRDLVKDLASHYHARVDMRQIGVRDEARLQGGYAPCGQELCCVRLGGEFQPVSIRMAKEQDLPLNSAKISGVCGRLMCCLRYEFEAYKDFKQRAPKHNAVIDTPLGKAKVIEYNTPRELITMRLENGKSFTVPLADMTCSQGCCKRAKEQNAKDQSNPLRPDTVTREALEKLGTAEILAQLAEMDRQNNPDAYDQELDSSLLTSSRKDYDRSRTSQSQAYDRESASEQTKSAGGRTPRRRDHGRPSTSDTPSKEQTATGSAVSTPAVSTRTEAEQEAGHIDQGARPQHRKGMQPRRQSTRANEQVEKIAPEQAKSRQPRRHRTVAKDPVQTLQVDRTQTKTPEHPATQGRPVARPANNPRASVSAQDTASPRVKSQAKSAQPAQASQPPRARRHHSVADTEQTREHAQARDIKTTRRQPQQNADQSATNANRRTSASAHTPSQGAQASQGQGQGQTPRPRRHHRHPGDAGGTGAGAGQEGSAQ